MRMEVNNLKIDSEDWRTKTMADEYTVMSFRTRVHLRLLTHILPT